MTLGETMPMDPFPTYLGVVGLIIGGLGIGFSDLLKSEPSIATALIAPLPEANAWPPNDGAIPFIAAWIEVVVPPVPVDHDTVQARYRLSSREPVREVAKRKKARIVRVPTPSDPRQEARVERPRESFGFFAFDSR
jgi:hypothetical protein